MNLNKNQSCAKNSHGFIDGRLGKKAALCDEAHQHFIFVRDAHTRSIIGVNIWTEYPKDNAKKVSKGVEDREIVVNIEDKNKKYKRAKKSKEHE